jgi:hypothetical protein
MQAMSLSQGQGESPATNWAAELSKSEVPNFADCLKLRAHYLAELARLEVLRHQGASPPPPPRSAALAAA